MGVVRNLRQVDADAAGVDIAFRADVHAGLAQAQKAIPARWFYDTTGSALFEDITALPEYYPTRSETDLLTRHAADIAAAVGPGRAVVELGSGSSTKTPLLLGAIAPAAYVPVDISGDFLRDSAAALAARFPGLPIYPVEADFTQRVAMPREICPLPKLGFFPGSTIGNMVARTAVDLLRNWREALGEESLLLIGIDRIKDIAVLERAYDDPAGVTAAFNLNLLERINRELGGDIPVENFTHRAIWNDVHARIEMHLVAACEMDFTVDGHDYHMAAGETIHSENSHKYGARDANLLLRASGWTPVATWDDTDPAFALILAEATAFRSAP
ncbi:L-histidine N(alpha)-methyltransferase [Sphingopyxis bauzanensis]|uniref:L-histidine N(Alpha)-methyltransferase n=1 Tax=Sphingopyxis bauzanensis TaxID=651663 RepID=A0A246JQ42_9SPHN|nr:L-histidine N(alpha)-methyltransferase [Sphingopyxis bauzanensis]OWQ94974.1 L-histidine N(alpha)-methyltransferase [Sphingopyxis bauzanensis]GGJ54581.1 dimethylhistidine N-methyltransferase [Sphingopyxis bauzanensis]